MDTETALLTGGPFDGKRLEVRAGVRRVQFPVLRGFDADGPIVGRIEYARVPAAFDGDAIRYDFEDAAASQNA